MSGRSKAIDTRIDYIMTLVSAYGKARGDAAVYLHLATEARKAGAVAEADAFQRQADTWLNMAVRMHARIKVNMREAIHNL